MTLCDQHAGIDERLKSLEEFKVDQKLINTDLYEKTNKNSEKVLLRQNAILVAIIVAVIMLLLNIVFPTSAKSTALTTHTAPFVDVK